MKRKKKILLMCHCILNANSKVEGLATYPSAITEIINPLIEMGIGIIQLPCPELTCYGIKRWGHVKEQFDNPYFRRHCQKIFKPYIDQILDYTEQGYEIVGLLGIDGSPSCGVDLTCSATWGGELEATEDLEARLGKVDMIPSPGVFISEIRKTLEDLHLNIPIIGIDETNLPSSLEKILQSKICQE